ncbi:hypothetical protein LY76DRAFT_186655 [Colletotrichum caudatum]|nr:hypothetical protein LY76DRAFT_186655 [Colletotrichum caudatum]
MIRRARDAAMALDYDQQVFRYSYREGGGSLQRYQRLKLPHCFVFRFYNGSHLFLRSGSFHQENDDSYCACGSIIGYTGISIVVYIYH